MAVRVVAVYLEAVVVDSMAARMKVLAGRWAVGRASVVLLTVSSSKYDS